MTICDQINMLKIKIILSDKKLISEKKPKQKVQFHFLKFR